MSRALDLRGRAAVRTDMGQEGLRSASPPPHPIPAHLEKLNLLKVTVFLMNRVKLSAWSSKGFLRGEGGM